MQGLLRFAGWGAAATVGLLLVAVTANSSTGRQRLSTAFADVNGTREAEAAKAQAAQAAQIARLAANENDTRRLIEIVRSLAGDRERLMGRVNVLERSLEDVTGSIKKQAAATPPVAPQAAPATTPQPPAAAEPPPKTAAAPPQTIPAEPAPPAAAPAAPLPAPPKQVASLPPASLPPASGMPELEAIQPRAAGVDVGGATSFDGLRKLWDTISATHYDLFEGMHPIVAVRENSKSRSADLRLIAGPLTDVETANRICTTLAAAKRYCRLVNFEGQPLALVAPEQNRRPATKTRTPVRTTAP
ncbi:MAG TPA: hypothetical protein VFB68_01095 [Xanthobacteraceae bacterium]|nr:hypothetical protein [Xanthobacteraceae bacterium]